MRVSYIFIDTCIIVIAIVDSVINRRCFPFFFHLVLSIFQDHGNYVFSYNIADPWGSSNGRWEVSDIDRSSRGVCAVASRYNVCRQCK